MNLLTIYQKAVWRIGQLTYLSVLIGVSLGCIAFFSDALHGYIAGAKAVRLENARLVKSQKAKVKDHNSLEQLSKDFSVSLPMSSDVQQILDEIRRSCDAARVVATAVETRQQRRSDDQLPRTDLTVSLRGSYPDLKRVFSEVLDRFPQATATRISIHRGAKNESVDATFAFALWARPETTIGSSPEVSLSKATR